MMNDMDKELPHVILETKTTWPLLLLDFGPWYLTVLGRLEKKYILGNQNVNIVFPFLCLDFFTEKYQGVFGEALYTEADQRLNCSGNRTGGCSRGTRGNDPNSVLP